MQSECQIRTDRQWSGYTVSSCIRSIIISARKAADNLEVGEQKQRCAIFTGILCLSCGVNQLACFSVLKGIAD